MRENECYESAIKYCACIEFRPDEETSWGFSVGQLIAYTLEPNPDAGVNKDMPQRLAIAFSTADVVILGRHLEPLTSRLRGNELVVVRAMPGCGGKLGPTTVFVASIAITPIDKQ
jgi:hypothetical protein